MKLLKGILVSKILSLSILGLLLFFSACMPPQPPSKEVVFVDYNQSETQRKLLDFQDRLMSDSVAIYLNSNDPTLRYLAARAFASIPLGNNEEALLNLLQDTVKQISAMAAYAIGQTGNYNFQNHIVNAFIAKDSSSVSNIHNGAILEAIGKIGDAKWLDYMTDISTYGSEDTLLTEGLTKGIFRFALRGIISTKGTNTMVKWATEPTASPTTRLYAAHYLQRVIDLDLTPYRFELLNAIENEPNIDVKIALLGATTNIKDPIVLPFLSEQLNNNNDDREKIASLKGLKNFKQYEYLPLLDSIIGRNTPLVQWAIIDFLNQNIELNQIHNLVPIKDKLSNDISKIRYLHLLYKHTPQFYYNTREEYRQNLLAIYREGTSINNSVEVVRALSSSVENVEFLIEVVNTTKVDALRTAAVESLLATLDSQDLKYKGARIQAEKRALIMSSLLVALKSNDVAISHLLAEFLYGKKNTYQSYGFTAALLDSLSKTTHLPMGIEAKRTLDKTLAEWNGVEYKTSETEFNHPIDFGILSNITPTSYVEIKTTKGNIKFKLFEKDAPGTVSSFLKLVRLNYYTKKRFHRIVPNFVTQGGCNRGDGFGSLDFTLRSEFSPLYYSSSGYLGMASAGPHSESQQLFITHTATPHLDGRYTIFGKVYEGMDVLIRLGYDDFIENISFF